jgi:hypothetical protein
MFFPKYKTINIKYSSETFDEKAEIKKRGDNKYELD